MTSDDLILLMLYELKLLMKRALGLFQEAFPTSFQAGVSTLVIPVCVPITEFLFYFMFVWSHIHI